MGKRIIIPAVILILALVAVAPLPLPRGNAGFSITRRIPVATPAVLRWITEKERLAEWSPLSDRKEGKEGDARVFGEQRLRVGETYLANISLTGECRSLPYGMSISASGERTGFTDITLMVDVSLGGSLVRRAYDRLTLRRIRSDQSALFDSVCAFFSDVERVYGFRIERELVKDANLVSLKRTFSKYPDTEGIYAMAEELEGYVRGLGARVTNQPMLFVQPAAGGGYEAMVGLATDRELPSRGAFLQKRMLLNGNMLVARAVGGPAHVEACLRAMDEYVRDNRKLSPAIPFQRLVTDRRREPDSTRWVTTVNHPVF